MTGNLSVNGLAGGTQSRYLTNSYSTMAGLDSGSFGDTPLFSFGNQGAYGMDPSFGMMGGMGAGMGMGMMGGMYGQNPTQYLQYQRQMNEGSMLMQKEQTKLQLESTRDIRRYQNAANSPELAAQTKVNLFNEQLSKGNYDNARKLYDEMASMIASEDAKAGVQSTPEGIRAEINARCGGSISSSIETTADSPFWHEFKKSATFGLISDKTSAEELKEHITGVGPSNSERTSVTLGKCLGYAALGATGIVAAIVGLKGGFNGISKLFHKAPAVATP